MWQSGKKMWKSSSLDRSIGKWLSLTDLDTELAKRTIAYWCISMTTLTTLARQQWAYDVTRRRRRRQFPRHQLRSADRLRHADMSTATRATFVSPALTRCCVKRRPSIFVTPESSRNPYPFPQLENDDTFRGRQYNWVCMRGRYT